MTLTLDHHVWATPDLDSGVAEMESRLGVTTMAGGRHPGVGTHNAVFDIGDQTYFELLAPDPTQDRLWSFGRRLSGVERPAFVGWACRTDDAQATSQKVKDAGLYPGLVLSMSRQRPDGTVLSWRLFEIEGGPFGMLLPFFVEWRDGGHPCDRLPDVGTRFRELRLETPDPDGLTTVLDALGVATPTIRQGETTRLAVTLDTPNGRVELG